MKYTALTIGPIIKSLSQARKTRELWAASYLFSYFMENISTELLSSGLTENDFVLPYPKARGLDAQNQFKRAGVFPDRIIIKHPDAYEIMVNAVSKAKNLLKDLLRQVTGADKKMLGQYINRYFRTNIIETEIPDGQNVIIKINELLACAELQETLIPQDPLLFLGILQKVNKTDLYKNVFGKNHFPSIIEISTRGLEVDNKIFNSEDDEEDWENFKTTLKEQNKINDLKAAHKYIAIVTADGDNVGELIKSIYENEADKIPAFSRALSQFSFDAVNEISKYGGEPVYAGGDDLLFFAPVVAANNQNIFHLIEKVDEAFKKNVNENGELTNVLDKAEKQPSLSFGLSVTYYKYPMSEALKEAYRLLFGVAKQTGNKNNIAYTLQKHSGQMFTDAILKEKGKKKEDEKEKELTFYEKFMDMLNDKQDRLISSLLYNLEEQKPILGKIADDNDRLTHFFDNFYDEDIHKKNKQFIGKVQRLIFETHKREGDIDKTLEKVYNALRFVKFINKKNDE